MNVDMFVHIRCVNLVCNVVAHVCECRNGVWVYVYLYLFSPFFHSYQSLEAIFLKEGAG